VEPLAFLELSGSVPVKLLEKVLGIVPTGPPKKIFPHRVIYVFFELAITSSLESKAALSAYPRLLV
jgi:hypothetical protein